MPKYNNPYAPFRKSKYKAQKVYIDGHKFDSKKEAKRYEELKAMEEAGEISCLVLQPTFVLIPAHYETFERYGKNGQRLKDGRRLMQGYGQCVYKADFAYHDKDGKDVVEDVKGMKTEVYKIKKKLMLREYGIIIKEV